MFDMVSRRLLTAAGAVALMAGCSGYSAQTAPGQPASGSSAMPAAPAGMRVLKGPAVTGPVFVPMVPHPHNLAHAWPAKSPNLQVLFVSDASDNEVLMYNPKVANSSPEGSITSGLNVPFGLAMDSAGTLYVANLGGNTITEYPKGQSTPGVTITNGVNGPYGIAVDSKGNVFISNLNDDTVVGYQAGQTTPFESINFSSYGQAVGLGIDGSDNLWVASDSTNQVYEIPAGSSTPQNSGLSGLVGPISVAFGKNNITYVSNFGGSNVNIYTYGSTTPTQTLTGGIETNGPTLGGFASSGRYFQTNQGLNVVGFLGYTKMPTSPFSTLTGNPNPTGIAGYPLIKK